MRKETVEILKASRNSDRKIMKSIRITNILPTRIRTRKQFSQLRWPSTKVIPIEKTLGGYISTMRQGFKRGSKWRANSPTYPLAPRSSSPDMTAVFHARPYGRFIGTQSNLRRKKLIERIKAPIFLDAVFTIKIM